MNNARTLPNRGLSFGHYPQRPQAAENDAFGDAIRGVVGRLAVRRTSRLPAALAKRVAALQPRLRTLDQAGFTTAVGMARMHLRSEGLADAAGGLALAVAAEAMRRALKLTPFDSQMIAAWSLLRGHLVEMATGEGKTLAAALAAAVGALGGTPVHVLTANDYLARRDRDALDPFYSALGLSSACVVGDMHRDRRASAWQSDIVHATAREVTFDYLRDHLALGGERDALLLRARALAAADPGQPAGGTLPQPLLPGLCMAVVDEADSILLDEAVVPLVLSMPTHAIDAAAYGRAYEIACGLRRGRDYTLEHARRAAVLTLAGRNRVGSAVEGATGLLSPQRRAWELVEAALAARLLYRRDREYAVLDRQVQLIDELTGRIARGRRWQGALHPMVEIKEGIEPSRATATAAQITYQRFFPRYLKIGGMSGTLLESRHELRATYGTPVVRIPLRRPSRRRWLGECCYVSASHKWRAVVRAIVREVSLGRPVLVGTDSVADSTELSALLEARGIAHQLLNATQDVEEAERIAQAGRARTVTVATNIAGRGTDIRLDEQSAAAGGLHVIAAMRNRSRRVDRQLFGRAARQGDPGSAESVVALDDGLLRHAWPAAVIGAAARLAAANMDCEGTGLVSPWIWKPLFSIAQRRCEWRDRVHRRELCRTDRQAAELYGFAGGTE